MKNATLRRSVTFIEASAIVIGVIIGSGIFLKPSIVLNNAGSPSMGILVWIVGGIITLASALTVAEIAAAIPKTGGLYTYLEELYGKPIGFLMGTNNYFLPCICRSSNNCFCCLCKRSTSDRSSATKNTRYFRWSCICHHNLCNY